MENIAIVLFGLESKHLSRCSEVEKSAYKRTALYFILTIAFIFLSLFYFFYLLTINYLGAFILSAVLSFVFFSIIRFTLLTIQLPLGEVPSMKKLLFNAANVFRITLYMILVFALVVPFSSFIFKGAIADELGQYKTQVYSDFKSSKEIMKDQQLGSITRLIDAKRSEQQAIKSSEKNPRLRAFKIELLEKKIKQLKINLDQKRINLDNENKTVFRFFKRDLDNAGMPFKRFEIMLNLSGSGIIVFLLFLALFGLLPMYMYVRYSSKFLYDQYFGDEMLLLIAAEYEQMMKDCSEHLQKEHNYLLPADMLYADPPFNRTRLFQPPTQLKTFDVFNHFEQSV